MTTRALVNYNLPETWGPHRSTMHRQKDTSALFCGLCACAVLATVLTALPHYLYFSTFCAPQLICAAWQVPLSDKDWPPASRHNQELAVPQPKVTSYDMPAAGNTDVTSVKGQEPTEVNKRGHRKTEAFGANTVVAPEHSSLRRSAEGLKLVNQMQATPPPVSSMTTVASQSGNRFGRSTHAPEKKVTSAPSQMAVERNRTKHPTDRVSDRGNVFQTVQTRKAELEKRLLYKTLIQKPLFVHSIFTRTGDEDAYETAYSKNKFKVANSLVRTSSAKHQLLSKSPSTGSVGQGEVGKRLHSTHNSSSTGDAVERQADLGSATNTDGATSFEDLPQGIKGVCLGNSDSQITRGELSLSELVKNCSLLKLAHRYGVAPVTPEETDFPLAFAIKMHGFPGQAEQLLRTIYRPHNFYCVHVDSKALPDVYETMTSLGACFANVLVVADRIRVVYASAAHVWAELTCMAAALASRIAWTYYINLTGEEFPLRTNLEMVRILKMFGGANDIESAPHPTRLRWRVESEFSVSGALLKRTNRTKTFPFPDFPIRKGSAYGSFSRPFVRALFDDDVAQALIQWFNGTFSPEENLWATVNALPWIPGGYSVTVRHEEDQHASRAVAWKWDAYRCRGRYLRSVCVLASGDLPWLLRQPHLVANKFKAVWDQRVLDCLEEIAFHRAKSRKVSINQSYFTTLPHVKLYSQHARARWNNTGQKMHDGALKIMKEDWLSKHAENLPSVSVTVHSVDPVPKEF